MQKTEFDVLAGDALRVSGSKCLACGSRPLCMRAKAEGREIMLRPRERHKALKAARREQETT